VLLSSVTSSGVIISFCTIICIVIILSSSIQINHQPGATIFHFIIQTFIYSSTCFGRSPAHHKELKDCSKQPLVLPSYRGDSRAVFVVGPTVKPEAATAVVELLMKGGRTPETCWAVNKRQDNKVKNCCIWLVIYLNCTMMHGLTNLKFKSDFIIVIRHPDDGHWSGRNMLVKNNNMWLNVLINMHMLAYPISIKLCDRCLLPRRWVASIMNLCKKWNVFFRPFEKSLTYVSWN